MRPALPILLAILPSLVNGQWSVGGLGHFSLNERGQQAEYGGGARITFAPSLRSFFFGDVMMNVPRVERWDRSYGARGALSAGIAPFTRRQGEHIHFQESLRVGCSWRIGRIHRKIGSAHFYWGLAAALIHRSLRYESEVTNLVNGTKTTINGTTDHFDLRLSPVFGFRSREGRGRFFAEALPSLQRPLDERSTVWDIRYEVVAGYLWNLNP